MTKTDAIRWVLFLHYERTWGLDFAWVDRGRSICHWMALVMRNAIHLGPRWWIIELPNQWLSCFIIWDIWNGGPVPGNSNQSLLIVNYVSLRSIDSSLVIWLQKRYLALGILRRLLRRAILLSWCIILIYGVKLWSGTLRIHPLLLAQFFLIFQYQLRHWAVILIIVWAKIALPRSEQSNIVLSVLAWLFNDNLLAIAGDHIPLRLDYVFAHWDSCLVIWIQKHLFVILPFDFIPHNLCCSIRVVVHQEKAFLLLGYGSIVALKFGCGHHIFAHYRLTRCLKIGVHIVFNIFVLIDQISLGWVRFCRLNTVLDNILVAVLEMDYFLTAWGKCITRLVKGVDYFGLGLATQTSFIDCHRIRCTRGSMTCLDYACQVAARTSHIYIWMEVGMWSMRELVKHILVNHSLVQVTRAASHISLLLLRVRVLIIIIIELSIVQCLLRLYLLEFTCKFAISSTHYVLCTLSMFKLNTNEIY